MGLDNPIHIAFLLILLLLVFGAKRLPEMGRSLGTGMRGFKESLSGESTQSSLPAEDHAPAPVVGTAANSTPMVASIGQPPTPAA
jgi:sec-independent protein translocase protein TatA